MRDNWNLNFYKAKRTGQICCHSAITYIHLVPSILFLPDVPTVIHM